jgi:hypothetical protein
MRNTGLVLKIAFMASMICRFFHATTVCRRQRNRIQTLRLENGEWGSDDDIVKG